MQANLQPPARLLGVAGACCQCRFWGLKEPHKPFQAPSSGLPFASCEAGRERAPDLLMCRSSILARFSQISADTGPGTVPLQLLRKGWGVAGMFCKAESREKLGAHSPQSSHLSPVSSTGRLCHPLISWVSGSPQLSGPDSLPFCITQNSRPVQFLGS